MTPKLSHVASSDAQAVALGVVEPDGTLVIAPPWTRNFRGGDRLILCHKVLAAGSSLALF